MANGANLPPGLRAVIFDLDGVIFDSRQSNIHFYNHLLKVVGLPQNAADSVEVIHREDMENSLIHLMGKGEHYARAMAYWRTMPIEPFIKNLVLFPGVRETLAALERRYRLGVVTNRARTTRDALELFGLWEYFETVITPLETGLAKPHPIMMQAALRELGLGPDQVLYVGDSQVDEQLCINSEVRLIAFANPELEAWARVQSHAELAELILGK